MHRYTGTDERTYPYARVGGGVTALTVRPGDEVAFDEPPADGRWEEIKPAPKKAPTRPTAVQE